MVNSCASVLRGVRVQVASLQEQCRHREEAIAGLKTSEARKEQQLRSEAAKYKDLMHQLKLAIDETSDLKRRIRRHQHAVRALVGRGVHASTGWGHAECCIWWIG